MIKNYFKTAFRNLLRNKSFSLINICGLAIGMASALLILLWVQNEMSYDRFHANTDRIYKVYNRDNVNGQLEALEQTPTVMASSLKQDFPEVEDAVRYRNVTFLTTVGEKHLNVQGAFADSGFLSMFSFPLLKGSGIKALSGNYNIVLTEELAKKLFGNEDAIGKIVRIDSADNFTVTGVLKRLPANTQFGFEYLLPWTYMVKLGWDDENNWSNNFTNTYVLLKPGVSQQLAFNAKVKNITINHTKGSVYESKAEVFTQPLRRLYLYSKSENGQLVGGRIEMVKLFTIIAIFILLIACINFMNLSTARSEKRAKEVGIRKTAGAHKSSIVIQFIGESIMFAFIAFTIALCIVQLSFPGFNELTGKQLSIDFRNPFYWFFAIAFVLLTGLIAGSYPAFYLSSFAPAKVLKGSFKKINALVTPRKVLVVLQFTFAIILIISTIIVEQQIKYAQTRDSGYNKNNLVFTFTQGDVNEHFDLIKHELLSSGAAVAVTRSFSPITKRWNNGSGYQWQGSTASDKKIDFVRLGSDAGFVRTIGANLTEGRDIDIYNYPTDSTAMLLNERAVKAMRLKNPVGQIVKRLGDPVEWHIVGVVKDFILESPFENINPTIIVGPVQFFQVVHFRLNPANSTAVNLAKAETIFKRYNPQYPFEYIFVDESYAKKFNDEQRTKSLAGLFAGLTIFISCLGLFGLAIYMTEYRIKEIGVRKVLGASVFSIASLLSKDFLKLIIISVIIASPVAYYAMNKWLSNYHYRTEIHWWIFFGAGLLAIFIALCTVSFHGIKAAIANPVKSLRIE
jgi:putative ABC transport system permease protein